jgi:hypothetical protein
MSVCHHVAGGPDEEQITDLGLEGQYLLSENQCQERMREKLKPRTEAFNQNPRCLGFFLNCLQQIP